MTRIGKWNPSFGWSKCNWTEEHAPRRGQVCNTTVELTAGQSECFVFVCVIVVDKIMRQWEARAAITADLSSILQSEGHPAVTPCHHTPDTLMDHYAQLRLWFKYTIYLSLSLHLTTITIIMTILWKAFFFVFIPDIMAVNALCVKHIPSLNSQIYTARN